MIVCSLHFGCNAQEQATATDADSRFPVPSNEELTSAIKTLKSVYAEEYQRAAEGDANQKRLSCATLAKKLLKDAKESTFGSGYAMLLEAFRFAILGESVETSFESIDLLAVNYQVDEHALRLQTLASFAETSTRLSGVREAAAFVIPSIRGAANAQELETAQLQIEAGQKIAKRLFDRGLQKDLAQAIEVLMLLQKQAETVAVAQKKLNSDSGDEEANLVMAKFIGLRTGDWEGAEVYAANVAETAIRSLFVRELAAPTETRDILQLGNDWWEIAKVNTGVEKLQAQRVAVGHYIRVLESLTGLEQKQTLLRIREVAEEQVIPVRALRTPGVIDNTMLSNATGWVNDGLVGYYPFNGNANDASGKGHDGVNNGAELVADRHGRAESAYHFHGRSDIQIPRSVDWNFKSGFTLSAWIKANDSKNAGLQVIVSGKSTTRTQIGRGVGWGLLVHSLIGDKHEAPLYFWIADRDSLQGEVIHDHSPRRWTHVVVCVDPSDSSIRLYVDGTLALAERKARQFTSRTSFKDSDAEFGIVAIDAPLYIGSQEGNDRFVKDCFIDDVRIYSRPLSDDEVSALNSFERSE